VTEVQKFKFVQKNIHLAVGSGIKKVTLLEFLNIRSISAVTSYRLLDPCQSNYDNSFYTSSHTSLELIQARTQGILGPHSLGMKRPKYTANHSPPSGAKAEIQWKLMESFFLDHLTIQNKATTFIWNVSNHSPNDTVSHPSRPESSKMY